MCVFFCCAVVGVVFVFRYSQFPLIIHILSRIRQSIIVSIYVWPWWWIRGPLRNFPGGWGVEGSIRYLTALVCWLCFRCALGVFVALAVVAGLGSYRM